MKLKSIKLHPFAGIRDKSIEFDDGLNVLLGPNEAGKSTIYNAILNGLLTTTSLTTTKVESEMGRFFPASGGDVIRVDLELLDEDQNTIRIRKAWKKGNRKGSASLHLADGTEITDEEIVQQKIEELLPVSAATLRTILLADQSGLHRTIREMEQEDGVRKELGDILRQNLMETGGVSVDRFRELLDNRYEEYFKRWDRDQDYPEKNRGISNPYKTGTGKVLDAYYQKEQLRLDLEEARRFEDELDQLNEQLSVLINRQKEKKEEFDKLQPLKKGISQRQLLEQKLETAQEKRKTLLEISQQWPVMEDRIKQLEPKKKVQQEKIEKLQEEQKKAQEKQQANQLESRIKKLEQLVEDVEAARKEVNEAKKVEEAEVKKLRELQSEVRRLNTQIEAARLTIKIHSKSDGSIEYSEAGKDEETLKAKSGEVIEKTVSGGFTLKTGELNIQVISGEGDLEQVIENYQHKKEELNTVLQKFEVESVQDAESFASLYQQKQQKLQQAEKLYKSELGEDNISDLKESLKEFGDLKQIRSSEDITDDLVDARTELQSLTKEADEAGEKLEKWKETYESVEDVILELADLSKSIKDIKREIEQLPELPEGFESANEFIEYVEAMDQDIRDLEAKISNYKIEKANLEKDAPDTSSEELEKMLEEAEADFERIYHEAETLAKVRERTLDLLESMDANTYSGLEQSFLNWVQQMVGNRFDTIQMNGDLPQTFQTDDGRPLTYEILSHGTKDIVALAWRFALTEYFLKDQAGFIVLDDPMVDMDPERRKMASEAIEVFAKKQQVLVMTCHPEHAKQIGKKNKSAIEFP
ncbi:MAG: AAA family ATPase [Balneolaceae bacterium]|nr:AAA family ATPase [Balneolaceae bacterium]